MVGSTRPGRKAPAVAQWALQVAGAHPAVAAGHASVALVDLADFALPLLDEPVPAVFGSYQHPHTQRWAATVAALDGFVFVTPEYNHSIPAVLKNAIDFLYAEWAHKSAGFIGYSLTGGVRAVEHLRQVMTEVKAVPTSSQVALSVFDDFTYSDPTDPTSPGTLAVREHQDTALLDVVQDCLDLSRALAGLRTPRAA